MIYTVRMNDKEYEVEVERGKATLLKTTEAVPTPPAELPKETQIPVSSAVPSAASSTAPSAGVPALADGEQAITSPLPGTILSIKVSPGKQVTKGETLLILEAMKMENEVVASADGIVSQIFVTGGALVATGDLLISIR
ncbi:MAG: biotin/lipoyl-containing protein [Lachnospiraceae bacterium]